MYNPLNFNINPKFKHFEFSRDHLPTVVVDSLEEWKPLKVAEVGVEYGGYLDIYYPQMKDFVDKFVYSVDFSCFFSKQYISSTRERLSLYKLLVELYDKEKIDSFSLNLTNIYGPQTKEVQNLISMRAASLFAGRLRLLHLNSKKNILKLVFDDSFQETSSLFELLKSKRLDSSVQKYFFKVLNDATSLELVIKKDVILDGLYIKLLLERLCLYGGF